MLVGEISLTKLQSADIIRHIYEEVKLHIDYCAEYGLSEQDMINYEEKQGMSFRLQAKACADTDLLSLHCIH